MPEKEPPLAEISNGWRPFSFIMPPLLGNYTDLGIQKNRP